MGSDSPSSTITADGTEIRWIDDQPSELQDFEQTIGQDRIRIRTDNEDGTVELQTVIPMHLVVNLHECLRRSEYKVIWEQLISQPASAGLVRRSWSRRIRRVLDVLPAEP